MERLNIYRTNETGGKTKIQTDTEIKFVRWIAFEVGDVVFTDKGQFVFLLKDEKGIHLLQIEQCMRDD